MDNKNQNVSVKDIARQAGVSIATVSRVINKKGRYSKLTEVKVFEAVEELNYVPNVLARGLRVKSSNVIGIIVPDITNEFFAQLVLQIQKELMSFGFTCFICNTDESYELERQHLNTLLSFRISGVIYISGCENVFEYINVPTIYIDREPHIGNENAISIRSDNQKGGFEACKLLLEAGCKKVACVSLSCKISTHGQRISGFKSALESFGINVEDDLFFEVARANIDTGCKITSEILRNKGIDGIFYTSDLLALGGIKAIKDLGLLVSFDVNVVGFDNISMTSSAVPSISTVEQNIKKIANTAIYALNSVIDGQQIRDKNITVDVKLVIRESSVGKYAQKNHVSIM